jgi:hypothetical protein
VANAQDQGDTARVHKNHLDGWHIIIHQNQLLLLLLMVRLVNLKSFYTFSKLTCYISPQFPASPDLKYLVF